MAATLSEGRVQLTRNHSNCGVTVHTGQHGEFVHLRCVPTKSLNENAEGQDMVMIEREDVSFRVTIGNEANVIVLHFNSLTHMVKLLDNLWVEAGEQVWVSTSKPNAHLVMGYTTRKPILQ